MIKFPEKEPIVDFVYPLRSRYGETDKMGYVYYGRYLEYFEVARTEMIRHYGLSYRELENSGVMLPVIHAEVEYKQPVFYDDVMLIRVTVYEVPLVKLHTYYEITTLEHPEVHIRGEVTLCFTDAETRKPCRAPEAFLKLFNHSVARG